MPDLTVLGQHLPVLKFMLLLQKIIIYNHNKKHSGYAFAGKKKKPD